ncbi:MULTISPECIES: PIG-L deacetylase family protein [unclassified Streptomyces]|uniref:PIG-L deacetylase family protein n=1 Tax=unclassified Streptomyces TaxID=2593676 RepID=UPI001EF84AF8|nr:MULTISPECIES: PIG-L deacetylase family protein [unclassified Streptomyces]
MPGPQGDAREHVVAVVAHPDDAELLCGGTLLRLRQAGARVSILTATHGANGVSVADSEAGRRLRPEDRAVESAAAWAGTGIELSGLGLEDGALTADRHMISLLEGELVRSGCTTLITHSPRVANDHQDHLAVAVAASNAATRVSTCRTVLYGEPHAPRSQFAPTVLVDITDVLDDKIKALQAHQSQAGRWYLGEEYTRHRAADAGWRLRPAAAAAGRSFEAFETPLLTLSHPALGLELS